MYHSTETLVIGGGAVGICCAYYLNKLGKKVAVVEKSDICSGSSYGNAGLIVPSYSIPLAAPGMVIQGLKWMFNPESPLYIKPRLDRNLITWLWKFRQACNESHLRTAIPLLHDMHFASLGLFEELTEIEGLDFGLEKKGMIELANTRKGFENIVKDIGRMQTYGVENRILEKDELQKYTSGLRSTAVGAVYLAHDAHLIPDRFVNQLARHIQHQNVSLLTSVEVLGFERAGRKVTTVKTTRGDIAAEEIILAAGSWSAQIASDLQLNLCLQPAKGYSLTFRRPEVCPLIPVTLAEAKVVITPMADTVRFAGTLELAGFDQSINQRRVQAILKAVPVYLPDFDPKSFELIEIWRGLRPCSPDGLPYIGRPPRYDNLILATGHGMLGISLAPITGKLVSQLAAGENPSINIEALRVERFN
jgi:D-amino-acid dehydrogenase